MVESFESQAGIYGEIGALWSAEEAWGPGCLLPRVKLRTSSIERPAEDEGQLAFLVQSIASASRRERLAWVALAGQPDRSALPEPPAMDGERAARIARDHLDGTTRLRMAIQKLRDKLRRVRSARTRNTGR